MMRTERAKLWSIVIAPSLWSVHFLACYVTTAIWCEKVSATQSGTSTLRWLVAAYTIIALVGIGWVALRSFQNFRRADPPVPYDFDDPSDRTHFLGFTAFLLSILSAIAVAFTALVYVMVRSCD
jgi:hypothetical protein